MDRFMKRALGIQKEQMQNWERILKPEYYKELEWRVLLDNENAVDEYGIRTGEKIEYIVKTTILNLLR